MTISSKPKVIALVGPTASGKSALGVELAKEFDGEIISADSRQVYKGLDVGSGKITVAEMQEVPHYLLDVADPAAPEIFSLSQYLKEASEKISEIAHRGKLPFLVGGTGLYISSLLEGFRLPDVEPNEVLREKLNKLPLEKLQDTYHALDPEGFKKIDISNPRRLVRAIEVVLATQKPFFAQQQKDVKKYDYLLLGIQLPFEELKKNIHDRLYARMQEGMPEEIRKLHEHRVSWERLEAFGLEYRWLARLTQGKLSESDALVNLEKDIISYAKRQLTWWRKRNVVWVKDKTEAEEEIKKFLN